MMPWCVCFRTNARRALLHRSCLLATAEEERRVADLSYDGLVVRLNSVQHLLDSLGGLERMVVDRCAAVAGLWVWLERPSEREGRT